MSDPIKLMKKYISQVNKSPGKRKDPFDDDIMSNARRKYEMNEVRGGQRNRFDRFENMQISSRRNSEDDEDDEDDDEKEEFNHNKNSIVIGDSNRSKIAFAVRKHSETGDLYFKNTRCLITGQTGSGKSYLTRNCIEKFFDSDLGTIIVFDPGGEYWTLRDHYDFLIFGREENFDIEINSDNAANIAENIIKTKTSSIINLNVHDETEKLEIAINFINACLLIPREFYTPIIFLIDEAHMFAKKNDNSELNNRCKNALKLLANTGRRRGISTFFITQRITQLHNDIVGACNNFLLGKAILDADAVRNAELIGLKGKQKDVFKDLSHHFLAYGETLENDVPLKFRSSKPKTKHLDVDELRVYTYPEPTMEVKEKIKLFSGKYKEKTQSVKNIDEILNSNKQKKEPDLKKFLNIIQNFGKIHIKDLCVLAIEKFEKNTLVTLKTIIQTKENISKYKIEGDFILYCNKVITGSKLKNSQEYLGLWKTQINDDLYNNILRYLFEKENCDNELIKLETILNAKKEEIINIIKKYENLYLVQYKNDCLYLNDIFFDEKIYGLPSIFPKEDENIELKEKNLEMKKRPSLKEFVNAFDDDNHDDFDPPEPEEFSEEDFE